MFFNLFKKNKNNRNLKKGFVLVETIVSVGIFSVVMTVGIGSLLSIVKTNKRAQSYKVVVNNINLSIESMSREIRTGTDYNCGSSTGGDCVSGADSIYFKDKSGVNMVYRLYNNSIQRSVNDSSFVNITSPDIAVDSVKFYVLGSSNSDSIQPRVVIVVGGHSGERVQDRLSFNLQTVATQRVLDL